MVLMSPRPKDDTLPESELAELKRNLVVLSGPGVEHFYRRAHKECNLEPSPKAIQQRWALPGKVLRGWG